jgi:metal-sulfur cluster biosynthetic enzyme
MQQRLKTKAKAALGLIREAIQVRAEITELYKQYRALTDTACFAAELNHRDVKRAVDALYYFGGGWPTENSKGRMEALLENFVGMYRILDFIGEGHKVTEHLAKFGVSVSLADEFKIENRVLTANEKAFLDRTYSSEYFNMDDLTDMRSLVNAVVVECMDLQRAICGMADKIKDDLKPAVEDALGIETQEYDRLHDIVRMSGRPNPRRPDAVQNKKVTINQSVSGLHAGLAVLAAGDE